MEELSRQSFSEEEGDSWTLSMEWEARIPPILNETIKSQLFHQYMSDYQTVVERSEKLGATNQDLIDLDELLTRCEPKSVEYYKIQAALKNLYWDSSFGAQLDEYDNLRAKLVTIHQRISDWQCRSLLSSSAYDDCSNQSSESPGSDDDLSYSLSSIPDKQPLLNPIPPILPNLYRKTPIFCDKRKEEFLPEVEEEDIRPNKKEEVGSFGESKSLNPKAENFIPRPQYPNTVVAAENPYPLNPFLYYNMLPNQQQQQPLLLMGNNIDQTRSIVHHVPLLFFAPPAIPVVQHPAPAQAHVLGPLLFAHQMAAIRKRNHQRLLLSAAASYLQNPTSFLSSISSSGRHSPGGTAHRQKSIPSIDPLLFLSTGSGGGGGLVFQRPAQLNKLYK